MTELKNNRAILQPLLTKKEVAEYLSISERTVDNFRKRGILKDVKIGNQVRFNLLQLQELSKIGTEVKNG